MLNLAVRKETAMLLKVIILIIDYVFNYNILLYIMSFVGFEQMFLICVIPVVLYQ